MKKLSILKMTLVIFAVMTAFNLSASAQDCSKTTDDQIVDAIQAKMKTKYADEMKHINVSVENGVVTLEGWAAKEKNIDKIGKLVKKIKCVKSVSNNIKQGITNSCGTGQKQCGEICIPSNQTCNIGKGN